MKVVFVSDAQQVGYFRLSLSFVAPVLAVVRAAAFKEAAFKCRRFRELGQPQGLLRLYPSES
jgi:hypothetical protein